MDGFKKFLIFFGICSIIAYPQLLLFGVLLICVLLLIVLLADHYRGNEQMYVAFGMVGIIVFISGTVMLCRANTSAQVKTHSDSSFVSSSYGSSSYGSSYTGSSTSSSSYQRSSSSGASGYKTDRCQEEGCNRENDKNGTVLCDYHAAKYVKKTGKETCSVSGCYATKNKTGSYCYNHTCRMDGCNSKVLGSNDDRYCSVHSSKGSTRRDTYMPTKRYAASKQKKEMPDCDDYEDYDEFMDDWEGEMPDGSDAQDYWENW